MHNLCGLDECCCPSDQTLESLPDPTGLIKNQKINTLMDDPVSTGRKRAALLYAFPEGTICEWAWHENCGGGGIPTLGCSGRLATNIHHGPDKSTLNNRPDNVSVICSYCHNLWHGSNDTLYVPFERPKENGTWLPPKHFPLSDRRLADPGKILALEISKKRPNIDYEIFNEKMALWKAKTN